MSNFEKYGKKLPKNQGDVAAKNKARKMITESKLEVVPVPFEAEGAAGKKEDIVIKL